MNLHVYKITYKNERYYVIACDPNTAKIKLGWHLGKKDIRCKIETYLHDCVF